MAHEQPPMYHGGDTEHRNVGKRINEKFSSSTPYGTSDDVPDQRAPRAIPVAQGTRTPCSAAPFATEGQNAPADNLFAHGSRKAPQPAALAHMGHHLEARPERAPAPFGVEDFDAVDKHLNEQISRGMTPRVATMAEVGVHEGAKASEVNRYYDARPAGREVEPAPWDNGKNDFQNHKSSRRNFYGPDPGGASQLSYGEELRQQAFGDRKKRQQEQEYEKHGPDGAGAGPSGLGDIGANSSDVPQGQRKGGRRHGHHDSPDLLKQKEAGCMQHGGKSSRQGYTPSVAENAPSGPRSMMPEMYPDEFQEYQDPSYPVDSTNGALQDQLDQFLVQGYGGK
ncbi:hypothetical protein CYMTET_19301 [Cymbomonas tetramitiformis]|uniref:Uncharacterized protein n=1 Tax=Cymbomonas tetramitiformis TaxID=36881 RepID=A0AAE0L5F4_9CHLO|nr:hypothetical protein CYMTET_19301 [Cymbomonas tetramitiformis]